MNNPDERRVRELEIRLANTETALISIVSLIDNLLPPPSLVAVSSIMTDYIEAQVKHGMPIDLETMKFQ